MSRILHFYNNTSKSKLFASLTVISITLLSCTSQTPQKDSKNANILGSFESKNVALSELSQAERNALFDAEKRLYDTAKFILEKHYLENWYAKYKEENKLTAEVDARTHYLSKSTAIKDEQVKAFISQNEKNPQMQQIPEKERFGLVKNYLMRVEQEKAEQVILEKAEKEDKIKVLAFEKPIAPVAQFSDLGYKYRPDLKNPKVTLVEFADYQCPYCVKATATINEILKAYDGKIQLIYRDFPLNFHKEAMPAAVAAKCADKQGKYWEMHKELFEVQNKEPLSLQVYSNIAKKINLNDSEFKKCLDDKDGEIKKTILADIKEAETLGINGTPTLYINGHKYEGNFSVESLKKEIDSRLASK